MARLRFGGPNLPDNAQTFYRHKNPDGSFAGNLNVKPGAVVDEERFFLDGEAQDFVARGMAAWVDEAPPQAPDPAPAIEAAAPEEV